jgi:cobalt-zinc-cadmium efflux system protein
MQDASGRRLDGRSTAQRHRGRLGIVIAIGIGILLSELVAGFATGSLALVADAAHVFADVVGSTLTLAAIWLGGRPATSRRTFGFYRMEILATVLNAVLLFAIAALVLVEAARRLDSRPQVASGPVLIVAAIALVANLAAARLLVTPQRESLALRTTYLEVLGDALGSCAVLAAALIMVFTGAFAADALASAFIGLLILIRTWGLLREAVDVLLEATPRDVDLDLVRSHLLEAPGVRGVHDLHAWTLTSGRNVVSAHVLIDADARSADVLDGLCRCLVTQFDIEHSTFQLETRDRAAIEQEAHV